MICELYCQEATAFLHSCPPRSAALIFADPPFNIGRPYSDWDDSMDWPDYRDFMRSWIDACIPVLRPNASLWLNVPDEVCRMLFASSILNPFRLVRWCIWHYRFGQHTTHNFISSKTHLLWLSNGKPPFHATEILEPSDRASKYNDPRTQTKAHGVPGLRVPFDVWYGEGFSRIQGNNRERRPLHDNQLPEAILTRIIRACTSEGDLVLDPFLGSGTTAVAAARQNRHFRGCDISPAYVESAASRVEESGIPCTLSVHSVTPSSSTTTSDSPSSSSPSPPSTRSSPTSGDLPTCPHPHPPSSPPTSVP